MANLVLAGATPPLNTDNPVGFFTNVASRLLSSELNLDLTRIQIYPTNQYTPAVHRLLQVAANVYDATTTNYYPSVFRPLFSCDQGGMGTRVYVCGYTNVPLVTDATDAQLAPPVDVLVLAATNVPVINLAVNVYGVPWIIGVKKGFPNFNEFVMENVVGITRRLQLTRNTNTLPPTMTGTNQMYLMSINSSLGVDFWNSYSNNYNGAVSGWVRENLAMSLTNDDVGFNAHPGILQPMIFSTNCSIFVSPWPGTSPWTGNGPNSASLIVPLGGTFIILTNSVYRSPYASATGGTVPPGLTPPCLIPLNYFGALGMTAVYETNTPGFPFPHFGLLATNQLQVFMLDLDSNGVYHVIDYAHFEQNSSRDLNAEIFSDDMSGVWNTNTDPRTGVPYGIENQINISRGWLVPPGPPPAEDGVWISDPQASTGTPPQQQASFEAFFLPLGFVATMPGWAGFGPASASNSFSSAQAPYSPIRYGVGYTILEANDPLVHYLASDMNPSVTLSAGLTYHYNYGVPLPSLANLDLGRLNENYQPWGGNPLSIPSIEEEDTNTFNLSLKDPLIYSADDWNFPNGQTSDLNWIGQVHRGTPWQTIYLKASDILDEVQNGTNIGTNTWMNWTGDFDAADAAAMAPVQDWHMASLLASLLNTNDLQSLISVNNPNPNSWLVLLDGLTALTNNLPDINLLLDINLHSELIAPQFDTLVISSNSAQASLIANIIQTARASQPNQYFRDVGDILSVPQLSEQSPFLNWNDSVQQEAGISDEAYELIPSQLLSLLRTDSIGSVVSLNGQILVQFTGYDGHAYAIQVSSDLINWANISTNCPVSGIFNLTIPVTPSANQQFYRSVLLQ
ncbi:MAG: hypothetical protein ACLQQ0_11025 [Limisphaerales bacterium]